MNLSLPFSGATPISRHRSAQAAQEAARTRVTKSLRYLEMLQQAGAYGLSDHEAAQMAGWALSSVNSIRNGCGGLIEPAERVGISPWNKRVTCWRKRELR